jgi:hypothetical protein
MKIGKPKQGVRWHPAYDHEQVRALVTKKVKRTIGMANVQWVEVDIVSYSNGSGPTKNLSME